jgi:hypothetical protein
MKMARMMLIIPTLVATLTTLGMVATTLAERNPSPVANIGAAPESPASFAPYDGKPLND